MALASIQHYTRGGWSNCAPHWLCFAAVCDAEAADSQETTLKPRNWRNVLQVSRASGEANAVARSAQHLWWLVNSCAWRNMLRESQCLQAHNCCYAQRPVVAIVWSAGAAGPFSHTLIAPV